MAVLHLSVSINLSVGKLAEWQSSETRKAKCSAALNNDINYTCGFPGMSCQKAINGVFLRAVSRITPILIILYSFDL